MGDRATPAAAEPGYRGGAGEQDGTHCLGGDAPAGGLPAHGRGFGGKGSDNDDTCVISFPSRPVKVGLVTSLARPSGNLTGVNFFNAELAAKQFELLHEMLPNIRRVAVLVDPAAEATTTMALHDLETAARASGMQIDVLKAVDSREIDKAFDGIGRDHLDGLFVSQSPFFNLTTRSIDPIGSPLQYPHDLPGT